jgi:hypothetical protein
MRAFIASLLTFMILWVSTWMVTDIHDLTSTGPDQSHPLFSSSSDLSAADLLDEADGAAPDCHVCSYDHGGHVGQTLPMTAPGIALRMDGAPPPVTDLSNWRSRVTTPHLQPPIA